MNNYESTLKGIKLVLANCGETDHENFLDDCINEWTSFGGTDLFVKGFSKNGRFEGFTFSETAFDDEEHRFWTTQLFGALVSMAMQLARFIKAGREMPIEYMRKNFGHPAEMISGVRCKDCGAKEINMADVDKYVTPSVISRAIIDGFEDNKLEENIRAILDLSSNYLSTERNDARTRALNTNVSVSSDRTPPAICRHCGSSGLERCRFLKSLKKPVFVALRT